MIKDPIKADCSIFGERSTLHSKFTASEEKLSQTYSISGNYSNKLMHFILNQKAKLLKSQYRSIKDLNTHQGHWRDIEIKHCMTSGLNDSKSITHFSIEPDEDMYL